jgi:hypothetical protein
VSIQKNRAALSEKSAARLDAKAAVKDAATFDWLD